MEYNPVLDAYRTLADRNGHPSVYPPSESEGGPPEGEDPPSVVVPKFPEPIPASQLQSSLAGGSWLWQGIFPRNAVSLFSSLWKAGKSTLLRHLLKALQHGGTFCGLEVAAATVLYVTEEPQPLWAQRRDELGLSDHVHFEVMPFAVKPRMPDWLDFLVFLGDKLADRPADLTVFDTISNLWPVRDENDAAGVQEALMPLRKLAQKTAPLLVHHVRKGDGTEATASRGSGALPAFVDSIFELRRYNPLDRKDRKRVLTGYGRWPDTADEVVIELLPDGQGYITHGDRRETRTLALAIVIARLLPNVSPGYTSKEVAENWPDNGVPCPAKTALGEALTRGADTGEWHQEGTGACGSPYTFWASPPPEN